MKRLLKKYPATLYGVAVILLMAIEQHVLTCLYVGNFIPYRYVYSAMEMMFLLSPYWLLRGRWRMAVLIPVWLLSAYFLADALYLHFWGVPMPMRLIGQACTIDAELISYGLGVFTPLDTVFVLFPALITLPWLLRRSRKALAAQHFGKRFRTIAVAASCLAYIILPFRFACLKFRRNPPIVWSKVPSIALHIYTEPTIFWSSTHYTLGNRGLLVHFYYEFLYWLHSTKPLTLTATERESIDSYLSSRAEFPHPVSPAGKNLVLVIVESLNSDVLGRSINGVAVTPTLDSLAHADGCISALRMIPQINDGHSADGQLMYNFGTLPALSGVASCDYLPRIDNLPSLPRLLPACDAASVSASDAKIWNEKSTNLLYGYRTVHTSADYDDDDTISFDGAMFAHGLELLKDMKQPFLLQFITMQMHWPCTSYRIPQIFDFSGTGLTEKRQRYLTCTADFDRHLGRFLQGLREAGLADNTIVVVASDHNAPESKNPDGSPADIVFIAANAGRTLHIDEPVHQVDVFPTMLDLMGVQPAWRGVGRSMLGTHRGESDPRQATVSDSILRSDYFPLQ